MGKPRNDVVGALKFQNEGRLWCIGRSLEVKSLLGKGLTTHSSYSRNRGMVIDRDIGPGWSVWRINAGTKDEMYVVQTSHGIPWEDKHRRLMPGYKVGFTGIDRNSFLLICRTASWL
jgi:hypothetical protein